MARQNLEKVIKRGDNLSDLQGRAGTSKYTYMYMYRHARKVELSNPKTYIAIGNPVPEQAHLSTHACTQKAKPHSMYMYM